MRAQEMISVTHQTSYQYFCKGNHLQFAGNHFQQKECHLLTKLETFESSRAEKFEKAVFVHFISQLPGENVFKDIF